MKRQGHAGQTAATEGAASAAARESEVQQQGFNNKKRTWALEVRAAPFAPMPLFPLKCTEVSIHPY